MSWTARYLVESFAPASRAEALREAVRAAGPPGERRDGDPSPARLVQAVLVPEDEICFLLYDAASPDLVAAALKCLCLPAERIVEAQEIRPTSQRRPGR